MRTTSVNVVRIATKGPGDVSGLLSLIEQGKIDPNSIVAILGKTEGNGGVNDFTRELRRFRSQRCLGALCRSAAGPRGAAHRVRDVGRLRKVCLARISPSSRVTVLPIAVPTPFLESASALG